MSNPVLVTVVTVCRNVKSSLEKTMNSLLHQSYAHIDYVIIDGASTDGTPEMLGKTEGVRWISEPDMGIYDAMNKGIRMAEGEWVIFMNAGDVFASDDTLSKVFSVERDADVIYGDVIKGDNIPSPGIPESFKVLLKELQSLGLDMRVLDEDRNEVQLRETIDYGDTDIRSVIESESRRHRSEDEEFERHGFTRQRFDEDSEQLVDDENLLEDDYEDDLDDSDFLGGGDDFADILEEE